MLIVVLSAGVSVSFLRVGPRDLYVGYVFCFERGRSQDPALSAAGRAFFFMWAPVFVGGGRSVARALTVCERECFLCICGCVCYLSLWAVARPGAVCGRAWYCLMWVPVFCRGGRVCEIQRHVLECVSHYLMLVRVFFVLVCGCVFLRGGAARPGAACFRLYVKRLSHAQWPSPLQTTSSYFYLAFTY